MLARSIICATMRFHLRADQKSFPGGQAHSIECAAMSNKTDQFKGVALCLGGIILISPDSLLLRLINADVWTLVFYRGGLSALGLILITSVLDRPQGWRRLFSIGRHGITVAVIFAGGSLCFVFAIMNTAVANALVIMSVSPLIAALLSHFVFHEPITLRTWLAAVIIVIGLALVFSGSMEGGGTAGDLAALAVSFSLAFNFVMIRKHRAISMIPAMAWSGTLVCLVAWPFAAPTSVHGQALAFMLLLGLVIVPVSVALITLSPRYISAPEASLIMRLEALLAPLWVWLVLGEIPSQQTLIGGSLIIATLVGLSIATLYSGPTRTP